MSYIIAVSKSNKNVLTATSPNDFIFHSGYNTFKIVARGLLVNQTINANPTTISIAHGLSNIPAVYALVKFPDGYVAHPNDKERSDSASYVQRYWRVQADATYIYFVFYKGTTSNYSVNIRYYIFEPPI
jgi:hypothetical protein